MLARAEALSAGGFFPFTTLRIAETGEFAETAAGTYDLTRRTTAIRAGKNLAFGVGFILEGGVSGKTVLIEARLFRPKAENGGQDVQAPDRWFVPARIGGIAQAVYLMEEDNPPPGTWTLQLYYAGEAISDIRFDLLVEQIPEVSGEASLSVHDAPPLSAAPPPVPTAPVPATKPTAPPKAAPKATSPSQTVFTVQTGVFSIRGNALRQAAELRAQGLAACILTEGEGKGLRYRVLAGRHARKDDALKSRKKLMAAGKTDAVVKSFPASRLDKASCR